MTYAHLTASLIYLYSKTACYIFYSIQIPVRIKCKFAIGRPVYSIFESFIHEYCVQNHSI